MTEAEMLKSEPHEDVRPRSFRDIFSEKYCKAKVDCEVTEWSTRIPPLQAKPTSPDGAARQETPAGDSQQMAGGGPISTELVNSAFTRVLPAFIRDNPEQYEKACTIERSTVLSNKLGTYLILTDQAPEYKNEPRRALYKNEPLTFANCKKRCEQDLLHCDAYTYWSVPVGHALDSGEEITVGSARIRDKLDHRQECRLFSKLKMVQEMNAEENVTTGPNNYFSLSPIPLTDSNALDGTFPVFYRRNHRRFTSGHCAIVDKTRLFFEFEPYRKNGGATAEILDDPERSKRFSEGRLEMNKQAQLLRWTPFLHNEYNVLASGDVEPAQQRFLSTSASTDETGERMIFRKRCSVEEMTDFPTFYPSWGYTFGHDDLGAPQLVAGVTEELSPEALLERLRDENDKTLTLPRTEDARMRKELANTVFKNILLVQDLPEDDPAKGETFTGDRFAFLDRNKASRGCRIMCELVKRCSVYVHTIGPIGVCVLKPVGSAVTPNWFPEWMDLRDASDTEIWKTSRVVLEDVERYHTFTAQNKANPGKSIPWKEMHKKICYEKLAPCCDMRSSDSECKTARDTSSGEKLCTFLWDGSGSTCDWGEGASRTSGRCVMNPESEELFFNDRNMYEREFEAFKSLNAHLFKPKPAEVELSKEVVHEQCSAKCRPGGQVKQRRRILTAAKNGGKACPTILERMVSCNSHRPCKNGRASEVGDTTVENDQPPSEKDQPTAPLPPAAGHGLYRQSAVFGETEALLNYGTQMMVKLRKLSSDTGTTQHFSEERFGKKDIVTVEIFSAGADPDSVSRPEPGTTTTSSFLSEGEGSETEKSTATTKNPFYFPVPPPTKNVDVASFLTFDIFENVDPDEDKAEHQLVPVDVRKVDRLPLQPRFDIQIVLPEGMTCKVSKAAAESAGQAASSFVEDRRNNPDGQSTPHVVHNGEEDTERDHIPNTDRRGSMTLEMNSSERETVYSHPIFRTYAGLKGISRRSPALRGSSAGRQADQRDGMKTDRLNPEEKTQPLKGSRKDYLQQRNVAQLLGLV
ncbi:unnamed protein product [Amoebophrya sp. A120]|nr:unnamed protein product [Amoebophrya sp. A120]|eukprot:GSA120T00021248001.1